MERKSNLPLRDEFQKLPQCGIVCPMSRENNKVKCVFFDEKDSIFKLNLVCVRAGK
jgi:hypothetical protein